MKSGNSSVATAPARHAMTLIEALLAVAILGICLAAIGPLVSLGLRIAQDVEHDTRSALLARSLFDRMSFFPQHFTTNSWNSIEGHPEWEYRLERNPVPNSGYDIVTLTLRWKGNIDQSWQYRKFESRSASVDVRQGSIQ